MSEGRRIDMAAPRPVSEIVRELRHAEQVADEAAVARLRAELAANADAANRVERAER